MKPLTKQSGMSFLGFIIVVGLICFFTLVVLKLFPLYTEKFAVDQSLESVANQPNAEAMSERDIHKAFMKNVYINDIDRFNDKNIDDHLSANKVGEKPREMYMQYEARTNMLSNIDIVLVYDKTVTLGSN